MTARLARTPMIIPQGIQVKQQEDCLIFSSSTISMELKIHPTVEVRLSQEGPNFKAKEDKTAKMHLGTQCALTANILHGLSQGYIKSLQLVGVGYRVALQKNTLELRLGFSHIVSYLLPQGVTAKIIKNTTIELQSHDKQLIGRVASEIRAFRPPEPYKDKGIRYLGESITLKIVKKK